MFEIKNSIVFYIYYDLVYICIIIINFNLLIRYSEKLIIVVKIGLLLYYIIMKVMWIWFVFFIIFNFIIRFFGDDIVFLRWWSEVVYCGRVLGY